MSEPQMPSEDPVTVDRPSAPAGPPSNFSGGSGLSGGPPSTNPLPPTHLTSTSTDGSRFAPGTVLADRYRIVSRLGKGGMGEVYRADDLKLGTSVALKFLPDAFAADPLKLDRFRSEVRLTREISHPNVCRVYDFGEIGSAAGGGGHHVFLSMEYVDGEDLSILLKRIGHLPEDKACQLARQICAGLHAAHELGVIHRDLKPANIMLDGRGNARIMDFGVAGILSDLVAKGDVASGTPAYMAPEQLARQGVSKKSDIYSLGLVLYELFTGKPAYQVENMQQLRASRESGTRPQAPSDHVKSLDPAVETVILRCLEFDPAHRPASALAVSAALPGGDPLAAALAAGETPSPELVALAGVEGSIPRRFAWAMVALVVVMVGILGWLQDRYGIHRIAPFGSPTDAMAIRAREMLEKLGADPPKAYQAYGYDADQNAIKSASKIGGFEKLANRFPPSIYFWYRAEPRWIRPTMIGHLFVGADSPPREYADGVYAALSSAGDLMRFERRAPEFGFAGTSDSVPAKPIDWAPFFDAAGVDINKFQSTRPTIAPNVPADTRYAWRGTYPDLPDVPVQFEAASLDGVPVSFRTKPLWRLPAHPNAKAEAGDPDAHEEAPALEDSDAIAEDRANDSAATGRGGRPAASDRSVRHWSAAEIIGGIINVTLLVGIVSSVVLAWKNYRAGRGDRRGALTLAVFVGAICLFSLSVGRHSVAGLIDFQIIGLQLARAMWLGGLMWIVYLALEPIVRRRWPRLLISWTRLLSGRGRDPLVWRDILIGCAAGSFFGPFFALMVIVDLQPFHVADPFVATMPWFSGFPFALAILFQTLAGNIAVPLLITLVLLGCDKLFRSQWVAYVLSAAFLWLIIGGLQDNAVSVSAAACAVGCMLMLRLCGLLAFSVMLLVSTILVNFPISLDLTTWYAPLTLVGSLPIIALAVTGALVAGRDAQPEPA
ncbi:MAG: serine/threonine protein kinase [Phycisphaeraceae bacterium]|nr:serine/threonine protein kinase [Phycisphaeraceae bacterium]